MSRPSLSEFLQSKGLQILGPRPAPWRGLYLYHDATGLILATSTQLAQCDLCGGPEELWEPRRHQFPFACSRCENRFAFALEHPDVARYLYEGET